MVKVLTRRQITLICREYRRNMTREEGILWNLLRNRDFDNLKFLRQHKIIYEVSSSGYHFFILDFYCHEKMLALEVDGLVHEEQKEYDEWRTYVLNERGIKVLRIRNEETKDLELVKQKIREACAGR